MKYFSGHSFNLISLASMWKADPDAAITQGIMVVNYNEGSFNYAKHFQSTEYSSNKPYISMEYTSPAASVTGVLSLDSHALRPLFVSGSANLTISAHLQKLIAFSGSL